MMSDTIIEIAKKSFLDFLEVANNRRNCNYTYENYSESSIATYYTDLCRYYFSAKYDDGIEYILVISFYDKEYIADLFEDISDFETPDIVTVRLIEDKFKDRCSRLFSVYGPAPYNIFTDESMSTENYLNTDISGMIIEDFLLG